MGEFSPPPPPPLFLSPHSFFFFVIPQTPQRGFGSITLLQKFTPHFKILDPRLNRSVGSVLEFQQNELQNQQKIVTLIKDKVAAVSKMMVINDLVLESKFLTLQKQWST